VTSAEHFLAVLPELFAAGYVGGLADTIVAGLRRDRAGGVPGNETEPPDGRRLGND